MTDDTLRLLRSLIEEYVNGKVVGPATEDKEGLGDVYKVVNICLANIIISSIFTIMTRVIMITHHR